jgi:hypothetical protein
MKLFHFHFSSPSFVRLVNVLKHFSVFSTLVTLAQKTERKSESESEIISLSLQLQTLLKGKLHNLLKILKSDKC